VRKEIILFAALVALTAVGCQKKEEPVNKAAVSPQAISPHGSIMQPVAPNQGVPQAQGTCPVSGKASGGMAPGMAASGGNPHAGMQAVDIPAGAAAHKGKVLQQIDAAGYTYLEIEEKGKKLWVAVLQTPVKKGDIVEIPDSPIMVNFTSKTLNRTFDEILFAAGVRVVK
jgi:hypothetical protein